MVITADQVKELRQTTDAPMMDCKKALTKNSGNMEKAIEWLRERGVAKSAKKANRIAAEGSIGLKISDDFSKACLVEINSETDFVAKNDAFKMLVSDTVLQAFQTSCECIEDLRTTKREDVAFPSYFDEIVAKIGEKIQARRLAKLTADDNSIINGYVHSNTRIGVIVAIKCDSAKTAAALVPMAKNIAMHISAMKPTVLSFKDFDQSFIDKETKGRIEAIKKDNEELARLKKPLKNIPSYISMSQLTQDVLDEAKEDIKNTLKKQGKPEKIWDKIIPGQMARFIDDNTTLDKEQALEDQNYVLDDKLRVAKAVEIAGEAANGSAKISTFIRLEVGEGIEKKACDFASEVAAQMS